MNTQQTLSQDERDALASFDHDDQKLAGKELVMALIIFLAVFAVCVPKIYVSGQIYYISRDLAKISSHLELLQEENKNLKQELEDFKFQQILRMEGMEDGY
ncbi:hypothetical protein [Helicobacter pametensis]|uniref:hypothetical protein n=1 Tax=Helicobacter pametensis TaxID=95149 RepID=UPI0004AD617A|nr:hypothetical protein [Helicobacter pametensis]